MVLIASYTLYTPYTVADQIVYGRLYIHCTDDLDCVDDCAVPVVTMAIVMVITIGDLAVHSIACAMLLLVLSKTG
jgi:hypothetical protein